MLMIKEFLTVKLKSEEKTKPLQIFLLPAVPAIRKFPVRRVLKMLEKEAGLFSCGRKEEPAYRGSSGADR